VLEAAIWVNKCIDKILMENWIKEKRWVSMTF